MGVVITSEVKWTEPGKGYDPTVKLTLKCISLNSRACELVNYKCVDVGVNSDGSIIIKDGNSYLVGKYKRKSGNFRGRIGAIGMVKQLLSSGAQLGSYKLVYNKKSKWWECFLYESRSGRKPKEMVNAKI